MHRSWTSFGSVFEQEPPTLERCVSSLSRGVGGVCPPCNSCPLRVWQVKFNCKRGDYDVVTFSIRVAGSQGERWSPVADSSHAFLTALPVLFWPGPVSVMRGVFQDGKVSCEVDVSKADFLRVYRGGSSAPVVSYLCT
jgi:hypothetical protein